MRISLKICLICFIVISSLLGVALYRWHLLPKQLEIQRIFTTEMLEQNRGVFHIVDPPANQTKSTDEWAINFRTISGGGSASALYPGKIQSLGFWATQATVTNQICGMSIGKITFKSKKVYPDHEEELKKVVQLLTENFQSKGWETIDLISWSPK